MDVSYNKLFKLLIDKKMKKKDLQEAAGLSPASIAKLSKGQYVSMDVLVKICQALDADIGDIMENCELHREMLGLPEYVFPAAMLVFGYPTQQQRERAKPKRVAMAHIVHENGYRRMDADELRSMFEGRCGEKGYAEWMQAFCARKYNSDFSVEMSRSVAEYLKDFC